MKININRQKSNALIKRFIIIIAVTIGAAVAVIYLSGIEPLKNDHLFKFPMQIGPWQGIEVPMEKRIYESLETDYAILRNYHRSDNAKINFAIVWYDDKEIAFHSASACLGGFGDRVRQDVDHPIKMVNGQTLTVRKILTEKFNRKSIVLYYYHSDNYLTGSQIDLRKKIILNRLKMNRTSAAFVRIMMPIETNYEATIDILEEFLLQSLPIVKKYTNTDV